MPLARPEPLPAGTPGEPRGRALGLLLSSELFWVLAAFALRAAFGLLLSRRFYQMDEGAFDAMARSLAERGVFGYAGAASAGAPVAPLFISLFYRCSLSLRAARLGMAAASTLTPWMIGRMTEDLSGSRRAGRLALAVAAVYPFFIYYSGMLMSETPYVALSVAWLWLLCGALSREDGRELRLSAAGAALSAAGLTRTEAVPIGLALLAALAGLCALGRLRWRPWLLALACWALPLMAWSARNKAACGAYTLDAHGGITMLHGSMLFDANEIDTSEAQKLLETMPLYAEGQRLDELSRDRLYSRAAVRYMREHPAVTLRQWARKFVNFWRFYPRLDKVYADTGSAKPGLGASRLGLAAVSLAFEPALLAFGLWGAWLLRRRAWELFPLYWMALATCAIHVVVVSQMRYRLAVMPVLMFFACAAVDQALARRPVEPVVG